MVRKLQVRKYDGIFKLGKTFGLGLVSSDLDNMVAEVEYCTIEKDGTNRQVTKPVQVKLMKGAEGIWFEFDEDVLHLSNFE